ncbi:MAG: hypothetical protein K6A32_09815 [Bacteroidales bacterium]|nr:hypothetical protein [Bacteroidales bacterium]
MQIKSIAKNLLNKVQKRMTEDHQSRLGDYSLSDHAKDYERIARELNTSPQYVYDIAHGMGLKTYDDKVIWGKLLQAGIVSARGAREGTSRSR